MKEVFVPDQALTGPDQYAHPLLALARFHPQLVAYLTSQADSGDEQARALLGQAQQLLEPTLNAVRTYVQLGGTPRAHAAQVLLQYSVAAQAQQGRTPEGWSAAALCQQGLERPEALLQAAVTGFNAFSVQPLIPS